MTLNRTRVLVGSVVAGLAVLTLALAFATVNQSGVARIIGYEHYGDERGIIVLVEVGALTDIAERNVEESADSVKVTVHVRGPGGSVPSYAIALPVAIPLHSGLRDRRVLDQNGRPVQDRGVYQPPGVSPPP